MMSSISQSESKVASSRGMPTLQPVTAATSERFKARNFQQSIGFALQGFRHVVQTERNFRIHLLIAAGVVFLGLLLGVSALEWGILSLCMGLMMAVEALNTAIEYTVDLITGGIYHEKAKRAKDVAATACLIMAISVAISGFCVFIPHLWQKF